MQKGLWSFNDGIARNGIIFWIDNFSSSHTIFSDHLQNEFLILDEGDTFRINGSFGAHRKIN